MNRDMRRFLAPLARRINALVTRGVVRRVDDGPRLQECQIELLADEVHDSAERWQQYGFRSRPQPGAEALTLAVNGERTHLVVISVEDRRYRISPLQAGEVALYTDTGVELRLTANGVRITGDVTVTGTLSAQELGDAGGSLSALRSLFNRHVHADPVSGNTGTPTEQA